MSEKFKSATFDEGARKHELDATYSTYRAAVWRNDGQAADDTRAIAHAQLDRYLDAIAGVAAEVRIEFDRDLRKKR